MSTYYWLWLGIAGGLGAFARAYLATDQVTFSKKTLSDVLVGIGAGVFWTDYSPIQFDVSMPIAKQAVGVFIVGAFAGDTIQGLITKIKGTPAKP